jgi:ADP-ribosylglycohydrolase
MTIEDRALGALYGLAIGDALGMPTQFLSRATIRLTFGALTDFAPGPEVNEISYGIPAGRVTDDTEQSVILATALLAGAGGVDHRLLADELLAWEQRMKEIESGEQLGPSTRRALAAIAAGAPLEETGRWGDTNGAAMRITPIGVATPAEPLEGLCDAVADACRITHDTTVANAGAAAVAAAVSAGVGGADVKEATKHALRAAERGGERGHFIAGGNVAARIRWALDLVERAPDEAAALDAIYTLVGTGVATQESVAAAFAIANMRPESPWEAGLLAANLGGDADTVAAMAGAITGACCGFDSLPAAAVLKVAKVNELDLESLSEELLSLRAAREARAAA